MAKVKRNISEVDSEEGFISNDDEGRKPKKTKKATASSSKAAKNPCWALSSGRQPRRVEVSEFKSQKLINIREFYEKDDEYLPGKKGISLTVDQWKALQKAIPEINACLKHGGIDVEAEDSDEDEEDAGRKAKAKATTKSKKAEAKANIEATSDEED